MNKTKPIMDMFSEMNLSDGDYEALKNLIYQSSGIHLPGNKQALVVGRLSGLLKKKGLGSFRDYLKHLQSDLTGEALRELVDKISTNHTYFFRETESFDLLKQTILPGLFSKMRRDTDTKEIRIWCAACATGEEAYSLGILAWEILRINPSFSIKILATDISLAALQKAELGVYPKDKLQDMDPSYLQNYFLPVPGGWSVRQEIRDLILFKKLNLNSVPYPFKNKFQVIFCRNVMIYFDLATRQELTDRLALQLDHEGWLVVGLSESLPEGHRHLKLVQPSVYRRQD